jgi:hypothetical protein
MSNVQANQARSYPNSGLAGLEALRIINPNPRPRVRLVAWPLLLREIHA